MLSRFRFLAWLDQRNEAGCWHCFCPVVASRRVSPIVLHPLFPIDLVPRVDAELLNQGFGNPYLQSTVYLAHLFLQDLEISKSPTILS
jgi:hypothetical protein